MDKEIRAAENGKRLLIVVAALMTIGVIMAASTAARLDRPLLDAARWQGALGRQTLFAAGAFLIMLLASRFDVRLFRWRNGSLWQPAMLLLVVAAILLIAVWLPTIGHASHGRTRWIHLGSIRFQPSEVAKLALVIYLSSVLARQRLSIVGANGTGEAPSTWSVMPVILALSALVGVEDFGTAVLIALVGGVMAFAGGCRVSALAAWAAPAALGFAGLLFWAPYRLERLTSFWRIWEDPLGKGYHAIQSLVAIASGGWTGRGLGAGVSHYGYLPEARTDFVFAVLCEETGVLGGFAVIALYITFVILALRIVRAVGTEDGGMARLFVLGVASTIGFQAMMNIAVVTVVAPTKGIPLPFVSAGGSGAVCFAASVGLVVGIAFRLRGRTAYSNQTECETADEIGRDPAMPLFQVN